MVAPRFPGSEARLSPFLTGTTVNTFPTNTSRTLNDLARRQRDVTGVVGQPDGAMGTMP